MQPASESAGCFCVQRLTALWVINGRVFTIMADFPQNFRFNHASQIAWRKSEFRIAKIIANVAALIGENDAVFTKMPVCRQIVTVWPIGSSLGLLPVAAALHQVFYVGFFEQAHQLGFLPGSKISLSSSAFGLAAPRFNTISEMLVLPCGPHWYSQNTDLNTA